MDTLELLEKLVAIPSVNTHCVKDPALAGEKRIADFVEELAGRHGIPVSRIEPDPGRPSLILELPAKNGDPEAPLLACFAHMDTVWVPESEAPFRVVKKEDGFYYGLGVTDDKGSLAAALLALFRLKEQNGASCRFAVVCSCDEEAGFAGIESVLPVFHPDAAIVMEGTSLDIVTAHKGTVRWRITTRGVSVHSSLVPEGRNAIYMAARLVLAMESFFGELMKRPQHKRLKYPTLSVGTIQGGTQPNSVPDKCAFMIDRRLLPGESAEQAEQEVRKVLDATGVPYELSEPTMFTGAFEIDETHPFVRKMLDGARSVKPSAEIRGLYCSTEAGFTVLHDIPTVVFGPGDVRTAHSVLECMDLPEIDRAVDILVSVADSF